MIGQMIIGALASWGRLVLDSYAQTVPELVIAMREQHPDDDAIALGSWTSLP